MMATYRAIASTETDPEAPLSSALIKALALNPTAIAEGATGAPYAADGWHPYNGVNVGDGITGTIYDFAVHGAVASVETPTFADGYEYMMLGRGLSGTTSTNLRLEWYLATSAAWSTVLTFASATNVEFVDFTIEAFAPRLVSKTMFFNMKQSTNGAGAEQAPVVNSSMRLDLTTAQKIDKARIAPPSGNFDAGQITLFKRRCYV